MIFAKHLFHSPTNLFDKVRLFHKWHFEVSIVTEGEVEATLMNPKDIRSAVVLPVADDVTQFG